MFDAGDDPSNERIRRLLVILFLGILIFALYAVMAPFLLPVAWAAILALAAWPIHRRILRAMPRFPGLAATLMVLMLLVLIIGPAGTVGTALFNEAKSAVAAARVWLDTPDTRLPEWIVKLPFDVGPKAEELLAEYRAMGYAKEVTAEAKKYVGEAVGLLGGVVGLAGRIFVQMLICLFVAYFLFRYGSRIVVQIQRVALRMGGSRFENLLRAVRSTVKGAVYGTVVTAIVQSVLAGVGFYFAETPVPLLFGLATFVVAFIPFGPPFVYIPLAAVVAVEGPWWHGLLLLLWGVGIVSTADNVLRPVFISQATSLPLLLVFFGVLGGVAAFGLIGVFIGPAVVAVAHVLWNEWATPEVPPTTSEMRIVE